MAMGNFFIITKLISSIKDSSMMAINMEKAIKSFKMEIHLQAFMLTISSKVMANINGKMELFIRVPLLMALSMATGSFILIMVK